MILSNVSFHLNEGEVVGLIGRSGSGKTSLLKVLAGLLEPEKGKVTYKGEEVKGPSKQLVPGHDEIKLVKQDFELMPYLSIEDNILRQSLSLSTPARKRLLGHLRNRLQLQSVKGRKATETSGGQKQRVALATALAAKARILLLDEPFSNLDYTLKQDLIALLRTDWKPDGMILVTHEPQDIMALADRILVLKEGKIIQHGPTSEVYQNPKNEYVARLLGPVNVLEAHEVKGFMEIEPGRKILLRPEELKLVSRGGISGEVENCHFAGSGYSVSVNAGGKRLEVWSTKAYSKGTQVRLGIRK
ncbi:MAG: ABC transporter ATP-binding protein [Owenweeksia sp.]